MERLGALMSKKNDLTGRVFGMLTAIRPVGSNKCGQVLWECACECGGTAVSASSSLLRGTTRSCGCLVHKANDLTGRKFGKLTVIRRAEKKAGVRKRSARWLCKCDCGREKTIDANALVTGNTTTCGDCSWGAYELLPAYVAGHFEDGHTMLIDQSDYPLVSGYRWWVDKSSGYFVTSIDGRLVSLHRLLMPYQEGLVCDHINRDKHDNRRANLRYATPKQNSRNRSIARNNTTGFIGVCWHIRKQKYVAAVTVNNRTVNLGQFDSAEEAARVRDRAARFYFGRYASLNFRGETVENEDSQAGAAVYAADIAV